MKDVRDLLSFKGKKTRKLGILLVSTLLIIGASVFVYSRVVYERVLNVGGVGTTLPAVNSAPETILVLAVLAFVISLSMFAFLRELSRRKDRTAPVEPSLPAPVPVPLVAEKSEELPPLDLSSLLGNWGELPREEERKD